MIFWQKCEDTRNYAKTPGNNKCHYRVTVYLLNQQGNMLLLNRMFNVQYGKSKIIFNDDYHLIPKIMWIFSLKCVYNFPPKNVRILSINVIPWTFSTCSSYLSKVNR